MKIFQLSAEPRTALGKKATKALRQQNLIPVVLNGGKIVDDPDKAELKEGQKCVVIGNGKGLITTDLTVKAEDVRKLVYTPEIFAIELNIKGEMKMAVLKDIQFHPVTDAILHIDLLEVYPDKPVVMQVPVQLEGHAEGVKAGGKLNLMMKKIKVKAPYTDIPERVVINVDNLTLGKSLQIGELNFEGFELVNAKNAVVCSVQLTRAARGQQAAAEAPAE